MKSLRDDMLAWGRRPQTPGIYRFRARMGAARMFGFGGGRSRLQPFRQLSRRSGCVPAGPYPPLSHPQSGLHQPCRAILLQRTATTLLTDCLTFGVHFRSSQKGDPHPAACPFPPRPISGSSLDWKMLTGAAVAAGIVAGGTAAGYFAGEAQPAAARSPRVASAILCPPGRRTELRLLFSPIAVGNKTFGGKEDESQRKKTWHSGQRGCILTHRRLGRLT